MDGRGDKMRMVYALLLSALLTACVPDGQMIGVDIDPYGNEFTADAGFFGPVDPNYPRPGVTYATASFGYGIQVEYFAADGSSYLWFPGNSAPLRGEWRITGGDLCFRYGANTRDAVTGQRGGSWECGRLRAAREQVVSILDGDAFGLSRGRLPDVTLKRCQLPPPMKMMTRAARCL